MRINTDLSLKQSLSLTTDMRLAIEILSMSSAEILELIDEELAKNPGLEECHYNSPFIASENAFDVLETTAEELDFRAQLWQLAKLEKFNYYELNIAYYLIYSLDERGFLPDQEEVYQLIIDELDVFPEWVDSVRFRIMGFGPGGFAAKDLEESLLFQLKNYCQFAHPDFLRLLKDPHKKIFQADIHKIREDRHLDELKALSIYPSNSFKSDKEHIHIDILVEKNGQTLQLRLLRRASSRLLVVPKNFSIKSNYQRAHFLLRALRFREDSLLKVARAIVDHQHAWFLGLGPLLPLSLYTIADICGLHESSISRLTRNKYLSCAKGTFELKHFFSQAALVNDHGEECSTLAIKDKIRLLIHGENKNQPLTDQQIQKALIVANMPIARRTVTKYRESLKLPIAAQRRFANSCK